MSNGNDGAATTDGEPAGLSDDRLPPATAKKRTRRRLLVLVAVAVVVALLAYALWALFLVPPSEKTDDAYVAGDTVAITARDAGTVIRLYADDTERVLAGQSLIDLDPAAADVQLAAAAAQLGEAVRAIRGGHADVDAASADVVNARTALQKAGQDLQRRQQAAAKGAVSGEEVTHARDAVTAAEATLKAAQGRLERAQAQVEGVSVRENPTVQAAIAAYRDAAIRRSHMEIVAPVAGTVAKRNVQIGQHIAAGTPLMAVVPLERVWVEANFRETQLADMRIGQPVRITTDIYGSDVVFHGRVIGLSAGTGDAFALLPPQNATGNWIKIIQRLPVRIALDPKELAEHPLRIGLSVTARVDTADTSGPLLGRAAGEPFAVQASLEPDVGAEVARIIRANSGSRR